MELSVFMDASYCDNCLEHITCVIGENGQCAIGCLISIGVTIGIGLFEANAIQFGLDQLLEAPTPKLITFIHWYYWSQNVGGLVVFYTYYASLGRGPEAIVVCVCVHPSFLVFSTQWLKSAM